MSPHLNASTERAPGSHLEESRWPEGESRRLGPRVSTAPDPVGVGTDPARAPNCL